MWSSAPIAARMIPDTSHTASAEASASSPVLDDAKTLLTIWSMPTKTPVRTFDAIAGPIVSFQSSCFPAAPRTPRPNSTHATPAMKVRNAIALAYVSRLCSAKRSTQRRTIALKLRHRVLTRGERFGFASGLRAGLRRGTPAALEQLARLCDARRRDGELVDQVGDGLDDPRGPVREALRLRAVVEEAGRRQRRRPDRLLRHGDPAQREPCGEVAARLRRVVRQHEEGDLPLAQPREEAVRARDDVLLAHEDAVQLISHERIVCSATAAHLLRSGGGPPPGAGP